jgi:hypothetical protein
MDIDTTTRHKATAKGSGLTHTRGFEKKKKAPFFVKEGDFDLEIDSGTPVVSGAKVNVTGTSNRGNIALTASCFKDDGSSFALTMDINPTNTDISTGKWSHSFNKPSTAGNYIYIVSGMAETSSGSGVFVSVIVSAWFIV